ncbi:phage portal protein [Sphingomonas carotinifaciens]|uniref:phage portal protein n=1 Tax=Sphingomonas carotinifaciens TaxID=1166323 RepID=UPI000DD83952|nr:phage portal protein [Sphingomonas carotinifaciens]
MSLRSIISGWIGSAAPAKLDGTPADREHNINIGWGAGPTFARKSVTPDSTMQLSAAWACVRLNARTIGSLPLKLYDRGDNLTRSVADQHPLYRVLNDRPNPDQGAMEFWEGQITALNLRGNAYARIGRRGDGQVVALWPLSPDAVRAYRADDGSRRYVVTTGRREENLPASEIFHLRGFGAGGDSGLSPISYGRQTIGTALASEEVAGSTFANGLQVAGFVEMATGVQLKPEQREQLIAMFEKFSGSSRAGKVMPLDAGMKFTPLAMSLADSQLLESRRFSVEEICRWFGTFPILIGHAAEGQTMWGSGIEQLVLAWLTLSLGPELTRIEEAIRCQLILPQEQHRFYAEHIVEGLLRADSAARAALYASLGQNGVMKRNEMRAKENLPPDSSPGADMLTVQSNLIPLDQLGVQDTGRDAGKALMSMLGSDVETMIDARVKAALLGHNGGPRLENGK